MKLFKTKPNIDLSKIIKYIKTADYCIGTNIETKKLVSTGSQEIDLMYFLTDFKVFSTTVKGSELIESERYTKILDLFNIEHDLTYIIFELHSCDGQEPLVYIFDNYQDYMDIYSTLNALYLNLNGINHSLNSKMAKL